MLEMIPNEGSPSTNVPAEQKLTCSAGAHFFVIDQQAILFSEPNQEIYALNTAAAYVWCLLEQGQLRPTIEVELAQLCQTSVAEAKETLHVLLNQWCSFGLLVHGGTIPEQAAEDKNDHAPNKFIALPVYEDSAFVSSRYYRLLKTQIRVRFTSLHQEEWVHPVLAHLENSSNDYVSTIDIIEEENSYRLYRRDTHYQWSCDKPDKLAPLIKGLVLQAAINNHNYLFNIHAGVVCDGQQCILLPAAAGSGKTSLTAALVHSGYYYFSDEIALLDESTFNVRAVPISLCVKSTGVAILQSYYPTLMHLKENIREDGKLVRYLPPVFEGSWPNSEQSMPVGVIIFPKYSPSAITELQKVSKITALNRLFKECMVLPKRLDYKKVAELVRWIKTVDCFDLPFCSLDQAVELINQLRKT